VSFIDEGISVVVAVVVEVMLLWYMDKEDVLLPW
jgi:hypothetical protein